MHLPAFVSLTSSDGGPVFPLANQNRHQLSHSGLSLTFALASFAIDLPDFQPSAPSLRHLRNQADGRRRQRLELLQQQRLPVQLILRTHDTTSPSETNSIMSLLATNLISGSAFGAALLASGVYRPRIIVDQFSLQHSYMLGVFLTASGISA